MDSQLLFTKSQREVNFSFHTHLSYVLQFKFFVDYEGQGKKKTAAGVPPPEPQFAKSFKDASVQWPSLPVRSVERVLSRSAISAMTPKCWPLLLGIKFFSLISITNHYSVLIIRQFRSGLCNIWSVPGCDALHTLRGHTCQVGSIVFRPQAKIASHFINKDAQIESDAKTCALASCSYDGSVLLWNLAQ